MLLTCADQPGCDAAVERLGTVSGAGGTMVLDLSADSAPDADAAGAGGQLQALLAQECNAAAGAPLLIVALHLDAAPLSTLAVINNALSESGSLQLDGRSVSTSKATFVFPLLLSPEDVPAASGEDPAGALERTAKGVLLSRLEGSLAAGSGTEAQGLLRALRRRLDLVVRAA